MVNIISFSVWAKVKDKRPRCHYQSNIAFHIISNYENISKIYCYRNYVKEHYHYKNIKF